MNQPPTRSTIYFEPDLHKRLRLKAASTHRSVSELVNEAVRQSLAEDREDLSALSERVAEPTTTYESMQHSSLRKSSRGQTVRLPEAAAFPAEVTNVDVVTVGRSRLITPAGNGWDVWFDGPGASDDFMSERTQPAGQKREAI